MKRLTFYKVINLILIVGFITLLIVQGTAPFLKIELADFWFPTLCVIIGILLIFKAIIFRSDSATWFGTFVFVNGAMLITSFYLPYNYFQLWPIFFSSAALSSLLVGAFFRDWLHFKISSFLAIISTTFYLYSFEVIGFWWFLLMLVLAIIFAVFVGSLIPERFYLNKKEK